MQEPQRKHSSIELSDQKLLYLLTLQRLRFAIVVHVFTNTRVLVIEYNFSKQDLRNPIQCKDGGKRGLNPTQKERSTGKLNVFYN